MNPITASFLLYFLYLLPFAATAPAPLPPAPPNSHIEIQNVTYGGTGCPSNTVASSISDDRTTLTLAFNAYTVQSGPAVPASERRKFCQLALNLRYPGGLQYSLLGADYRGYASLEAGVQGRAVGSYYFSGQARESFFAANFSGPMDENYVLHDTVESLTRVWAPCGEQGLLNIKSEVRIAPMRTRTLNLLTVDSLDGKFTQKFAVQWRKCEG
ncbi:hypothetical protein C7974DRAFT_379246 [Boeremia exigua]|uniref:uncharacterized protein n=1 Tax=Boeremia exigua TaxID=749465 RepID=UPI001E8CFCCB|nr:uncharacterized protein C7974DRAFT_379246 [Boeremia exigua]KAH6616314.1 hypothetical protein C7974DRAFT_379246 [Boeremia exigua]